MNNSLNKIIHKQDILGQYTIEQYFLFCKEFLIKRNYLIEDYQVTYIIQNNKVSAYYLSYDNGKFTIQITLSGLKFIDNFNSKIIEEYTFPQTELLINKFFTRV